MAGQSNSRAYLKAMDIKAKCQIYKVGFTAS